MGTRLLTDTGEVGQHGAIIIGSFDFPESVLLADIYAHALTAQGLPVGVLLASTGEASH